MGSLWNRGFNGFGLGVDVFEMFLKGVEIKPVVMVSNYAHSIG